MRESLNRFVGSSVRRVEDVRLLTGKGRYVDDVVVPAMLHAAFVRSPYAHAQIRGVEVAAARRLPGVVAVFTGADIVEITNPYVPLAARPGVYEPSYYSLAVDRARFVGDPVALVVAESRRVAEDACALVDVDYAPLEPVASIADALDAGRPVLWPKSPHGNVVLTDSKTYGGDERAVDAAFARADRVVTERFRQHRVANQPMETRGLVVEITADGAVVLHAPTQSAHVYKWLLAMLAPKRRLRDSVSTIARDRTQLKAFLTGAKAFASANPEMSKGNKDAGPAMMKTMGREPQRVAALSRSIAALLATPAGARPEVLSPDIGGAFGSKGVVSREDICVYAAAVKLRRSVKYVEDRTENLMGGGHAREEHVELSVALRNDGTLLAMKASLVIDGGAYPAVPFSAALFAGLIRVMLPGPYRVPLLRFDSRAVCTNKGAYVAYRGPWAVETWVRERMLDVCADELGIGRDEIRLRNMIGADELPTPMVTGPTLDVRMSAKRTLTEALEHAGYANWRDEQAAARAQGRLVGLGFATFIEAAPGPPGFIDHVMPGMASVVGNEPVTVTLDDGGTVSIYSQQMPHGQSHETTFAQVAADELGVAIESIHFVWGDTKRTPFGLMGTGGSRAGAMTGGAVAVTARELHGRIVEVAAEMLEADRRDVVVEDGVAHVAGVPARGVTLADVAAEAKRQRPDPLAKAGEAMRVAGTYDGGAGGWAQATHACWVEIDPDTGVVTIARYLVVEDCGELINPAIVDGQIRGGVAQGIGQVLYEHLAYDAQANLQTSTYLDYLVPTATEIPPIEIHHLHTPSDVEANYRGVGEGGMIAAPAALTNAIEDALRDHRVRITESYLPPSRILELMRVVAPN